MVDNTFNIIGLIEVWTGNSQAKIAAVVDATSVTRPDSFTLKPYNFTSNKNGNVYSWVSLLYHKDYTVNLSGGQARLY